MIKRVKSKQLKPGMYIHDINCGWMENPFFSKSFKVDDDKTISKIINQGIHEVYIDTDKGDNVKDAPTEKEIKQGIEAEIKEIAEHAPEPPPVPSPPSEPTKDQIVRREDLKKGDYDPTANRVRVKEEIQQAEKIQSEAKEVVYSIMDDVRLGKQIETEKTDHVVEQMVDSVFRNQHALASLGRIKSADEYTFQHSVSVCVLMISFCKTLGIDKNMIQIVGQGAMLHDLGKMMVPNEVLNKPGKLTDEEFAIMKSHVNKSREILLNTPNIAPESVEVAAQHHERYDGTGYPFGLKGDEIGVFGQMSAIVDVYDAITSTRCYHRGMSSSDALKKMLEWSTHHFNKDLMQQYIRAVGVYPVGTLVKMKSGHLAVVTEPGTTNILLPTVKLIYSLRTQNYLISPKTVDLAKPNGKGGGDQIVSNEDPDLHGINPLEHLGLI